MTARLSVWSGLLLLSVLNVADVLSTQHALERGGIEGNPVARVLLDSGLLLVAKLGVVVVLCALVWRCRRTPVWLIAFVWLAVGFYLSAVVGNVLVGLA